MDSRLTPVIPRLYGVQVFADGILLISRNPPLIFSRFNIPRDYAPARDFMRNAAVRDSRFPATRDEEKMKRPCRRADRERTADAGGGRYSFICQGADFVNSFL